MAQTYAIIHDGTNCLVFQKNARSYFFQSVPTAAAGVAIQNGPGSRCFAGGRLNGGEAPATGALREFREETGYTFGAGVIAATNVVNGPQGQARPQYYGVYFRVTPANLAAILAQCQANLTAASTMAGNIQGGRITTPVQFAANVHGGVEDNELNAQVVSVTYAAALAYFPDDQITGWFRDLVTRHP